MSERQTLEKQTDRQKNRHRQTCRQTERRKADKQADILIEERTEIFGRSANGRVRSRNESVQSAYKVEIGKGKKKGSCEGRK